MELQRFASLPIQLDVNVDAQHEYLKMFSRL